jgi:aspartyl protease family protein
MLRFTLIALTGAVAAVGAANAVTAFAPTAAAAAHQQASAAELRTTRDSVVDASAAAAQPASISKASDGHFWAEAVVNGERVRFLVDTGATAVALTAADAERLGFSPKDLDFTYEVTTASGPARAASVKLASVSVAGARVADVDALVIEKGLDTSLLGMTYLGRLSRFEASPSALILRP